MKHSEMGRLIGRTGLLTTAERLKVPVRITDARWAYGLKLQVSPVSAKHDQGTLGTAWVSGDRVEVDV